MDNYFLAEMFDWNSRESQRVRVVNRVLSFLGLSAKIVGPYSTGYMTNIEVRMNIYHLISGVLAYKVPGDVLEVGCHTGETAALLQVILHDQASQKGLHVYDSFEGLEGVQEGKGESLLMSNFNRYQLKLPQIHKGWFKDTLPGALPEQVAFAHIDIGPGASPEELHDTMLLVLESIFPRVSPGGVLVFADYVVCSRRPEWKVNISSTEPIDDFFSRHREKPHMLYAGAYSHGFVRKAFS